MNRIGLLSVVGLLMLGGCSATGEGDRREEDRAARDRDREDDRDRVASRDRDRDDRRREDRGRESEEPRGDRRGGDGEIRDLLTSASWSLDGRCGGAMLEFLNGGRVTLGREDFARWRLAGDRITIVTDSDGESSTSEIETVGSDAVQLTNVDGGQVMRLARC